MVTGAGAVDDLPKNRRRDLARRGRVRDGRSESSAERNEGPVGAKHAVRVLDEAGLRTALSLLDLRDQVSAHVYLGAERGGGQAVGEADGAQLGAEERSR